MTANVESHLKINEKQNQHQQHNGILLLTNNQPAIMITSALTSTTSPITLNNTSTTTTRNDIKVLQHHTAQNIMTSKLLGKNEFLIGPSAFRPLMPIALCLISFATVLSILIVYMDTTEIRHQQFRLNMSRDYDLLDVQQNDPTLITYVRDIHMKKYPLHFLNNAPIEHLNFTQPHHELAPKMAEWQSSFVDYHVNGTYIQSMTYSTASLLTGPWLTETLNWKGVIIEPEPRHYFSLEKQNVHRSNVQVIHACISPNGYPKEVTLHHNDEFDTDVRINSLLEEETWFNSRVKCFPLYTMMLAVNYINIDLLSLGCSGQELQILETVPFDKVNITIITLHLQDYDDLETPIDEYIYKIIIFLKEKSYKLVKGFDNNYIFKLK